MIEVPEGFAQGTEAREGAAGAAWLAELPGIVGELLSRWGCVPDGAVMHGSVGVVVPVVRPGGAPAVLKVSFPHPGNVHEPDAFAAWGGHGAVRLHARSDEDFAMLLERAGTTTLAAAGDLDEITRTAGRLSRRLAVPAPPELPRLSAQADQWEEQLTRDIGEFGDGPGAGAVAAALATLRELAPTQPDTLLHGDLHPLNILRGDRPDGSRPWLAVDPKGYAGDPAHDGGTLLKSLAARLLHADDLLGTVTRLLDVFADAAEVEPARVRRWAQLHAVQTAFWVRRHGYQFVGGGPGPEEVTRFADALAVSLTSLTTRR